VSEEASTPCDFEAEIEWLDATPPIPAGPDASGVRFEHLLAHGVQVTGTHRYPVAARAGAGGRSQAEIRLAAAPLYPRSLWKGRAIQLFDRQRHIGVAHVTQVKRTLLDRDATECVPLEDALSSICGMILELSRDGGTVGEKLERYRLGRVLERVSAQALCGQLERHRDWVDAWYLWAEANRFRAGPFLFRYKQGGWAGLNESSGLAMESYRFDDPVRACAEFIAIELEDSGIGSHLTRP